MQNVLQSFWNSGELPTVDTTVAIDDRSIINMAIALITVALVVFLLFKIVKVN